MRPRKRIPAPSPERLGRLMEHVNRTSVCWLWTGKFDGRTATIRIEGQGFRLQRVAYHWLVGPFDPALVIIARCGDPCCVNPAHLRAQTMAESGSLGYWRGLPTRAAQVARCEAEARARKASRSGLVRANRRRSTKQGWGHSHLAWSSHGIQPAEQTSTEQRPGYSTGAPQGRPLVL